MPGARAGERHLFFHHRCLAGHVRKGFGRFYSIRRVGDAHMAVRHERVILAVHGIELGNVLNDDVDFAAVSRDVGERLFHDRQLAQGRELVQEQQEAMLVARHASAVREFHLGADAAHNHIHHEPQEWAHPVNVRRGNHQVEVHRLVMVHEVMDAEVAMAGIERHNRIAVQRQVGQSRGNNAARFILRFVQHLSGGTGDKGVGLVATFSAGEHFLKQLGVWRFHHFLEQVFDGTALVRQHAGEIIERGRIALTVAHHDGAMQNRPGQHGKSRLAPMILQAFAVGIDQHGRHVLHVRNGHHGIEAQFFQGVEGGGRAGRIGRVKAQHHLIL